jgi:curved DNA-binding protein CbpA
VLGVAPNASLPAVKRAYWAAAKRHHPDAAPTSNGSASPQWCAVLEAFTILSDPHLLAEHDRLLAEQRAAKAVARPEPEPPPSRAVAVARAGVALLQMAYLGGLALLLLLIAILATYQIATGH